MLATIENLPIFVIAQCIGCIAIALLLICSLKQVSRNTILVFNIIINLIWALHYLLLKAYTGSLCCLICAAMVLVFRFKGANKFLSGIHIPLFFIIVFIVFGIVTWDNWTSILPIVINCLLTIALWIDREFLIKTAFIPIAALWIIYNLFCFSYIGIIGQSLSLCFHAAFVIKTLVKARRAANDTKK